MRQDGSSHDRQVRVGADGVMRQHFQEIHQADKCRPLDLHRYMCSGKHNAVFIVVHIRRILQEPVLTSELHRDQADRLARRMVQAAGISFVLRAEQAFRIGILLFAERCRDRLRILFRFGQIDRDIQVAVTSRRDPFSVLCDTVSADIVGVAAQFVVIIRRLPRIFSEE